MRKHSSTELREVITGSNVLIKGLVLERMSHTNTGAESTASATTNVAMVDPRAPRFGQLMTMSVLLIGIGLQEPLLILAIAVILNAAVLSGWRITVYGVLWRRGIVPFVGKSEETEPAAPHRFAKLMGAGLSAIAAVLLFGGSIVSLPILTLAGYAVALVLACAAAIGGLGGYCLGCRMYQQVAFFRRLGVV